uniref:Uncharacterized protein n=1 Tax=Syphacia muris TaxID=451379 RepID=A0A0N5ACX2_9BILA
MSESDRQTLSYINADGRLHEKINCPSSLLIDNTFGIPSFNIPYSTNKKGRWKLLKKVAEETTDFQDAEAGLRVTFVRRIDNGSNRNSLPLRLNGVSFSDLAAINEIHSVSQDGSEIHKQCKTASYKALTSKPRPSKRKRRYHNDDQPTAADNEEDRMVDTGENHPLWERKAHVIYLEEVQKLNPRIVNSNESLIQRKSGISRFSSSKKSGERIKSKRKVSAQEVDYDCFEVEGC